MTKQHIQRAFVGVLKCKMQLIVCWEEPEKEKTVFSAVKTPENAGNSANTAVKNLQEMAGVCCTKKIVFLNLCSTSVLIINSSINTKKYTCEHFLTEKP